MPVKAVSISENVGGMSVDGSEFVKSVLDYKFLNSGFEDKDDPAAPDSFLILPKSAPPGEKLPLICVPHGGPHSGSVASYIPSYAYLSSLGYGILHVNYRGSLGYGDGFLDSLPGHCGSKDVEDCVKAVKFALDSHGDILDKDRVGVCGGSHGGYLAGHLTSQHPDVFKVAAMRNPVTNIATMVTATDIPDWCYVESTGSYDFDTFKVPSADQLDKMFKSSPAYHVKNVKSPTLVAIGMSDLRVPPSQGKEWYYALKSMGVPSKLLCYKDDSHPISIPMSEGDHWINIAEWFKEHL